MSDAAESSNRAHGAPDATVGPSALDARSAAFVTAYFNESRNAAKACAAIGISPRKASKLMGDPAIAGEIERRQAAAAAAPSTAVSLDALIADARAAYAVAAAAGNANAMVSAVQLLARLTGRMDGEAPELNGSAPVAANPRQAARAVIELFREAVLEEGGRIGVAGPGETLVRVPTALAATVGGEVASEPALAEHEVFANGAAIELVETVPARGKADALLPPVCKWAVRDALGVLHGYRRDRAAAVALAQSLPPGPVEVKHEDQP